MLNKTQKQELVNELTAEVSENEALIISDYKGLKVTDIDALRKSLAAEGFKAKVTKNRLIKRAFDGLTIELPEGVLKGQNMFFQTKDNVVGLTKILVKYSEENENLKIKGGIFDGQFIGTEKIDQLSKLPSKEVLIAKLIGQMKAPMSRLTATLSSPVNGLVGVLTNIKNKIGGE